MPRDNYPQLADKGIPQVVALVVFTTILYTVQQCTCTKSYTLQTSLLFWLKWEIVPIILAYSLQNKEPIMLKIMLP